MTNPNGGGNTSTGGGNAPPGGGSAPPGGGSTPPGGGNTLPNIADLSNSLTQLAKNSPADLKLDQATLDKYLDATSALQSSLITVRNKMNNLETLENVGDLPSAKQTKNNLDLDVTGLAGIQKATEQYIGYLEQLMATMIQAGKRLIKSG